MSIVIDQPTLAELLPAAVNDVTDLLAGADLGVDVAACPGWDVAGLVDHLGGIHQWCRAAVVAADPDAGAPEVHPEPAPRDAHERDAVLAWYSRHSSAMVAALTWAGPDAPPGASGPGRA